MSTRYIGDDGRPRIKLDPAEALDLWKRGVLPLTPQQVEKQKKLLQEQIDELNDRLR